MKFSGVVALGVYRNSLEGFFEIPKIAYFKGAQSWVF
jgi:hypothetical protein